MLEEARKDAQNMNSISPYDTEIRDLSQDNQSFTLEEQSIRINGLLNELQSKEKEIRAANNALSKGEDVLQEWKGMYKMLLHRVLCREFSSCRYLRMLHFSFRSSFTVGV
jgi:hypothetical protein